MGMQSKAAGRSGSVAAAVLILSAVLAGLSACGGPDRPGALEVDALRREVLATRGELQTLADSLDAHRRWAEDLLSWNLGVGAASTRGMLREIEVLSVHLGVNPGPLLEFVAHNGAASSGLAPVASTRLYHDILRLAGVGRAEHHRFTEAVDLHLQPGTWQEVFEVGPTVPPIDYAAALLDLKDDHEFAGVIRHKIRGLMLQRAAVDEVIAQADRVLRILDEAREGR